MLCKPELPMARVVVEAFGEGLLYSVLLNYFAKVLGKNGMRCPGLCHGCA
jgi:hypothetical protein